METNIEFKEIALEELELNEGQIQVLMNDGSVSALPKNPRQWTFTDIERLKKSIVESPEMIELRGLIVYPYGRKYVAIGGNMRLTAMRDLGWTSAPCAVIKSVSVEKLAEIAIKDNGQFGRWDIGLLKTDWKDVKFAEWGIDVFDFPSDEPKKEKSDAPIDNRKEWSIVLSADEFDFVNCTLRDIGPTPEKAFLNIIGYGK